MTHTITARFVDITKEIHLTQGKVALVDDEDCEYLSQWKWCAHKERNPLLWYALRFERVNGKSVCVRMHREIMSLEEGQEVDHINGDGLDNRRENIRVCSSRENSRNRGKTSTNKSGYKGVIPHAHPGRWQAQINAGQGTKYLGLFKSPIEAAQAYDSAAIRLHGDFANLNFPLYLR